MEFEFKNDCVTIQSYIDFPDEDCEAIRLSYTIGTDSFTTYDIKAEKSLIASCEDFITFLNLAQTLEAEVQIQFSCAGRPIISKISGDGTYTLSLIQATLPPRSYAKRNIKNLPYDKVVKDYIGRRKTNEFEESNDDNSITEGAGNPEITFTASNQENNSKTINETSKTKSKSTDHSSQTYMSTPSVTARGKRKSTDEIMIVDEDMNQTRDNLQEKRRRLTPISTVIGSNMSIVLSQREINEVNDIMSDIASICETPDDNDVDMELPVNPPAANSEELAIHEMEMLEALESERTTSENLFSHNRWSLHHSYMKDTEGTDNEKNSEEPGTSHSKSKQRGALDKLFGHIFKPRSKVQFGRVLVPGSDSESEDN